MFGTEAGWGGRWHQGGPLTLLLDVDDAPYERVSWTDQRGCSASGSSFLGWSQRVNEGPVGYRGTRQAAPAVPVAPSLNQELAVTAVQQLAGWWRKR